MANTFVLLGDLKAGLYFSTILVRLLRFWWCGWEPRNSRRGGELMGADMFLLDAKVIPILKLIIIIFLQYSGVHIHKCETL